MARARNIKPGFFKNEDLSELSPYARLLFVGLWCLADREGYLEDRPKRIKGELFPYENVNVDQYLNDLHVAGFIIRYEVDGERYISIPKFSDHQNPHHREAASRIPKPEQAKEKPRASLGPSSEYPRLGCGNTGESTYQGSESDQKSREINNSQKGSGKPRASTHLGNDEPQKSRADSLIPDSLNLIPDSLIPLPPTTDSVNRGKKVVVGGRDLYVYKSVIEQYKHYFVYEPNQTIMNLLHSYLDDEVQMDMLAWAMRDAAEKGKAWNYAKGTIEKLFARGIRTAEQADLADQEFKQRREQKPPGKVVQLADKLPESVQWQMQQEQAGANLAREAKSINDFPEMAERLKRLRSRA
ncbi:DnaD domain protein [Brevibacillus agri]|uniref:DnaD domain protein n=1 Tax=Brevibacillus agri TaxID=51101 RepID=UPI003D24CEF5